MRIEPRDIHWLAGLLEGEGCFTGNTSHKGRGVTPAIQLEILDRDIAERAARLLGGRLTVKSRPPGKHCSFKPICQVRLYGAPAVGWMMTLWTLLGERRRARIVEVLKVWRSKKKQRSPQKLWAKQCA